MNWLDIVVLVVMAIGIFLGLRLGIIKAVLSLAGLIVGVILAGRFNVALAEQLTFISQDGIAEIVAFGIILIGVMLIAVVLAGLIKWAVSAVMLGWVNQLGGAVFGFVVATLLCGSVLAIWVKFLGAVEVITQSNLAGILLDRFPAVLTLLPGEFDSIRAFFQ